MAFEPTDWTITRNAGDLDVRYVGDDHGGTAPTYVSTIQLHRALADFADDEVDSGDDELSIIDQTPSDRGGADTNITLLNGCNLDDASAQFIYDGSITQDGGDTIYDGIQVFGNSSVIQVIQNGTRIDDDFWNYPKMKTAVEDAASGTTHRFTVKTRTGGADIDGRRLLGTQRELGTVYTEFFIGGGTNRGNNVLALTANSNLNNQTAEGTIEGWDDIVNDVEGYTPILVAGVSYDFYADWELGAQSKNNFYERAQWIQMRVGTIGGSGDTRDADQVIYGLQGDIFRGITHEIDITPGTGTWVEPEAVSWAGGTGQLLAVDDTDGTSTTKMWIQLLTGVAPSTELITGNGSATGTSGTVEAQTVSLPFIGASTGTAIIGSFGLGIGADDLTNSDLVFDLTGTARTPPNNVTFTVNNVKEDDYVIVANNDAGNFDLDQRLTNAPYTGAITEIVTTVAIPTDIPAAGTLRLELDSGEYQKIDYLSFTGSTFDVTGTTLTSAAAAGNNLFVTYIDKVITAGEETATFVSKTFVYDAPRTLFVRARNAGTGANTAIKTAETTAAVGTGGGSATLGRIDDF